MLVFRMFKAGLSTMNSIRVYVMALWMSQLMNQGTVTIPAEAQPKRRRGRPRKGYFLSVRVGNSNVSLRGVVFKEECIVPVTPENDIAPNTKMHKRKDFPIPPMNVITQVAEQTARNSSLNPGKNIEIQQQEKVPSPSVTQKGQSEDKEQQDKASDDKEQQEKASEDKKQQEKASDGKEQQEILADVEDQEKLSLGAEIIEEVSAKMESLKDLSEPPVKKQKTDETTVSLSNEEDMIQHDAVTNENSEDAVINENSEDAVTNENSEDAVKPLEEANNTVLPKETNISPPQIAISLKDSSVVDFPTVMEQDICTNSGFQISMENPDDEDELSEPPNDISPMETEQGGDK
uniref:Uncharacterized protein n=1 Tax=Chenopodium quinoa TaxID=63459 RepID=A0A803M1Y7_CHEQI